MTSHSQEKAFEILDKTTAYAGYFQIIRYRLRHTLFAGGWSGAMVREVFERGHAAAVLPYDPVRDAVVLIQQFRVGAMNSPWIQEAWLWEIVAGILEEGETPLELVHREAQEEAGCTIADVIPMYHVIVSPGGATETLALFCGRVDATQIGGIHGLAEEHEDIHVQVFPYAEALDMLHTGKICSGSAIIAMQWLALHRDNVRQQWCP